MAGPNSSGLDRYEVELGAIEDYRSFSACTIQRFWRGHICRAKLRRQLQAQWNAEQQVQHAENVAKRQHTAACTIQDAWRRHSQTRIYRYYRDLLRFRERGDPRELLRSINPREAALADAASGVHVRFRLGGATFPPLVFYKIFTHRPVTDICAFCPRAYALEAVAALPAAKRPAREQPPLLQPAPPPPAPQQQQPDDPFDLKEALREYIRPDGSRGKRSTRGWYRRHDNNGWRPVAERLLLPADAAQGCDGDGVRGGVGVGSRGVPFHHDPVVRREERVRRLKQRKRKWLLKLYMQGMLPAAATQQGSAAAGPAEGGRPAAAQGCGGGSSRGDAEGWVPGGQQRSLRRGGQGQGAQEAHCTAGDDDYESDGGRRGGLSGIRHKGSGADDGEVDRDGEGGELDLLEWSQGLDFEGYLDSWTSMACSLPSGALDIAWRREGELVRQLEADAGPPVAAAVAAGVALGGSGAAAWTWQPFKGGVSPAAGATSGLPVA